MTLPTVSPHIFAPLLRAGLAAAVAVTGFAASAQVRFVQPMAMPALVLIPVEAANADKVKLLVGLTAIQSELQIGILLLQQSGTEAAAPYLARASKEFWPSIKDGILAAGGPDLAPDLAELEKGGDPLSVNKRLAQVSVGLAKARAALAPTTADQVGAIVAQGEVMAASLNPAGPTDVAVYRDVWSLLLTTRTSLDLLMRDPDPAVVDAAGAVALALDDLILSLPDPSATAPVAMDPAQVQAAFKALADVAGGV